MWLKVSPYLPLSFQTVREFTLGRDGVLLLRYLEFDVGTSSFQNHPFDDVLGGCSRGRTRLTFFILFVFFRCVCCRCRAGVGAGPASRYWCWSTTQFIKARLGLTTFAVLFDVLLLLFDILLFLFDIYMEEYAWELKLHVPHLNGIRPDFGDTEPGVDQRCK